MHGWDVPQRPEQEPPVGILVLLAGGTAWGQPGGRQGLASLGLSIPSRTLC